MAHGPRKSRRKRRRQGDVWTRDGDHAVEVELNRRDGESIEIKVVQQNVAFAVLGEEETHQSIVFLEFLPVRNRTQFWFKKL